MATDQPGPVVLSANDANLVPLSEAGWSVVLWVTVGLSLAWLVAVALWIRLKAAPSPSDVPSAASEKEESAGFRISARLVLVVVVGLSFLALVVFLVGRAGDLAA